MRFSQTFLIILFTFLGFISIQGSHALGDFDVPRDFNSREFKDRKDFQRFFLKRSIFESAQWPELEPRSYVISVDFTLSAKDGLRILEFNGPTYPQGVSQFGFLARKRYLWPLFVLSNPEGSMGSGHAGHDQLYAPVTLDEMIALSSYTFAVNQDWFIHDLSRAEIDPRPLTNRMSWLPLGTAIDTLHWHDFRPEHLLFNHPVIIALAHYKSLLMLLPDAQGVSVPSTTFLGEDLYSIKEDLAEFMRGTGRDLFILKPVDECRGEGVTLIRASELLNASAEMIARLDRHNAWMLQPYMPSDAITDKSGGVQSPVGRIFYHLIYDGEKMQITPLTAYQKLNGVSLPSPEAIMDPQVVRFGPMEASQEFSRAQLERIVSEFNRYFERATGDIFQLTQKGLVDNASPLAGPLRERFKSLKPYEKRAIRSVLLPNFHTYRHGKPDGEEFDFLLRRQVHYADRGLDVFRSPIYESLKKCADLLRSE